VKMDKRLSAEALDPELRENPWTSPQTPVKPDNPRFPCSAFVLANPGSALVGYSFYSIH